MIHHLPVLWSQILPGTVVVDSAGTPREVMHWSAVGDDHVIIYLSGVAEGIMLRSDASAYPVTLDENDAMINLFIAGFAPERIEP